MKILILQYNLSLTQYNMILHYSRKLTYRTATGEQARRVTDRGRENMWGMTELKHHQG